MNISDAKKLAEHGAIRELTACQVSAGLWQMLVKTTDTHDLEILETALGGPKLYASLDSLDRDAVRIVGDVSSWKMTV